MSLFSKAKRPESKKRKARSGGKVAWKPATVKAKWGDPARPGRFRMVAVPGEVYGLLAVHETIRAVERRDRKDWVALGDLVTLTWVPSGDSFGAYFPTFEEAKRAAKRFWPLVKGYTEAHDVSQNPDVVALWRGMTNSGRATIANPDAEPEYR